MGYYDSYGWRPYVSAAERRRTAEREMQKLKKTGHPASPVKIEGREIARSFWGKAWCDNLEHYSDYANRLPRGRTYARNGSVLDLQVAPGEVKALVSGSMLYRVTVKVSPVAKTRWTSICADCGGAIDSLVELLQGRFSRGVMDRICRQKTGLFPTPGEIKFTCSCPDWASMCKHVAAVLYGVGARLDEQPELIFTLRKVDANDLIAKAGQGNPPVQEGSGSGEDPRRRRSVEALRAGHRHGRHRAPTKGFADEKARGHGTSDEETAIGIECRADTCETKTTAGGHEDQTETADIAAPLDEALTAKARRRPPRAPPTAPDAPPGTITR